ncbi:hypothetical protein BaRGS_00004643, partial [Batillaria attramentaria]
MEDRSLATRGPLIMGRLLARNRKFFNSTSAQHSRLDTICCRLQRENCSVLTRASQPSEDRSNSIPTSTEAWLIDVDCWTTRVESKVFVSTWHRPYK